MDARLHLPVTTVVCLVLLVPVARAQQADTTQLPEIAPREIEIRGERQIALPSLQRQPLIGFTVPPQLPTVPDDHQPYIAPYKQPLEGLPESLPIPESVARPLEPAAAPASGFVQGGAGRYLTRFAEGRMTVPLSGPEVISLHGAYTGLDGFSPYDGTSVETPADEAQASVRLLSRRAPVRVEAGIHGSAQRYLLYGVQPTTGGVNRNGYTAGSSLTLRSVGRVRARAGLSYDRTKYTTEIPTSRGGGDRSLRQDLLDAHGSVTVPAALRPHAQGTYNHSWYGGDVGADTGYGYNARGTVSLFESDSTVAEIGATVLGFDAPSWQPSLAGGTSVSAMYVAPYVNVEWDLSEVTTLYFRNQPRRRSVSLDRLFQDNPYAERLPEMRPTVETTNAEAGLTFSAGFVRLTAAGGYRYAPTYRYYEPGTPGSVFDGVFRVRYGSARVLEGRGQIGLQGIPGVQASLGVSVRDGRLGSQDAVIPNFAPITADAMFSVSFADNRGFFEAIGQFESPRYATTAETNQLDSYVAVDLEASFALSSSIELLARAENLAPNAPVQWAGYSRPPAQVSTGLRIQW